MNFADAQTYYRARVDQALTHHLSRFTEPARLSVALNYVVLSGGKRLRPLLVYAAGECLGVEASVLDPAASAVELIHAYSLVHDDLPAMDNDDLRRGLPTCHKAFDEATAILAGDGLQALAFQLLSENATQLEAEQCIEMIRVLSTASGIEGMVGGQARDLAATNQTLQLDELATLHQCKTGALIRASVQLGALAAPGVTSSQLTQLDHYAKAIGYAFQIQDDILDIEVSTAHLGKQQGADIALNKSTYPKLMGLSSAKEKIRELHQEALHALHQFDDRATLLRQLSEYVITRDH